MRQREQIAVVDVGSMGEGDVTDTGTFSIAKAMSWAINNLPDGEYSMVRKIPGVLKVGEQKKKTASITKEK